MFDLKKYIDHKSLSSVEFSKDVLENTAVLEIFDFNVSIQSDLGFELLSVFSSDLDPFVHLQVSVLQVNVEFLCSFQS